ncbi:MAG: alpha/beta [Bacteroidetes bacterium]|nr:MAG: alpha/beta [Bacteroidota bacterium]
MKVILIYIFTLLIGLGNIFGQEYSLYSNDKLSIESEYLQETIDLNLHLPETQAFSANTTKYPITIIFDSQHERTYPLIINSIDLLTSETQIPESIIIGVPFNFQNRLYLTSSQKRGNDSLSGIERMELFLFNELIPQLQNKYKGNGYISFIGHSRTAFLVNYLAFKRPDQINLAVSLSGFFNDAPLSLNTFHNFLADGSNFPYKFSYYYTAGTSLEESTYLVQYRNLDSLMRKKSISENVKVLFSITPNANHITNYWVSLPPILIDAFSSYNSILDSWFHDESKAESIDNPLQQFEMDLEQAGKSIGVNLNPNLTHIFSLASHYANKEDYLTAIKFFELGLDYFPEYLELYVEIIELYKVLHNTEKISSYKGVLREKSMNSLYLTEAEKQEVIEYLDKK